MIENKSILSSLDSCSFYLSVTLVDGFISSVKGIGIANANPHYLCHLCFIFQNAPLICLSIFLTHFVFQELELRKTIGTGCECSELYYLDLNFKMIACFSFISAFDSHYRLGHPFLQVLKLLIIPVNHVMSLDCASRQLGKHHHMSYPDRINKKVDSPFSLVHSNVWGSYPITSKLGFNYFYNFCEWLFSSHLDVLMKICYEAFSFFQNFYSEVKNQFSTFTKILRTDNAKKFF